MRPLQPPRRPLLQPRLGKPAPPPPQRWRPPPKGKGHPRRHGTVLLPALPYPVFERTIDDPVSADDAQGDADRGDDLVWSPPEPLEEATRATRPGLFVIERSRGGRWVPLYVGMSSAGVGQALRWIVQAPVILGLDVDWPTLRVRIAEASFGTDPAGRAALRRKRDETAAAIERAGGRPVLKGPGP
ncbi:MAG: hypothetical protein NVSMB18_06410 [Acetobacteraceae bacterium]